MIKSNLHTHTTFCDGKNTPEDVVKEAIERGFDIIGFSAHAYTPTNSQWCLKKEREEAYAKEIIRLKEEYKDKIKILLGLELDYYSEVDTSQCDYTIGSVHYVYKNGKYYGIDSSPELFQKIIDEAFEGDVYAFIEEYYRLVGDVYNKTKCDIIGHFDLITKFNENGEFFDTQNPRYKKAVCSALESLLPENVPFEVNTGAISRGYRTEPYPAKDILQIIEKEKGRVIITSDSHQKETIDFYFDEAKLYAESTKVHIIDEI